MVPALANKSILITRPEGHVNHLSELVTREGGRAVVMPMIIIEPFSYKPESMNRIQPDFTIFTSKNAVDYMEDSLVPSIADSEILAVGKGTAQQLQDRDLENIIYPADGAGSEALLDLPELQKQNVDGKSVLIIKGSGGRDMIESTLLSRGASVSTLDVYTRRKPQVDTETMINLWQKEQPDVIVFTSGEAIENMVEQTPEAFRNRLFATRLVVLSSRIAGIAGKLGFEHSPVVCSGTDDESVLKSILSTLEDK